MKTKITTLKKLLWIHLAAIALLTQSCATILSGTKDRVVINTTPPNADVYIDGEYLGKSSQDLILKRKYTNTRNVNIRLDGYQDLNFIIEQKITPAYFLGVLGFGLPCFIDIATGAALMPKKTEFNRVLTPKDK